MGNIVTTINDHIRRVARREMRGQTVATKRASAKFRRDIAALKKTTKTLSSRISHVEKKTKHPRAITPENLPDNVRFRPDGLRSHREKLGISAKDYGRLIGVSGLTIYNWESGKSKPRRKQLAGVIGVRGLGKREAIKRLAEVHPSVGVESKTHETGQPAASPGH